MATIETKSWVELSTAGATLLLAGATVWLAGLTRKLEKAWFRTSAEQIGVSTWLELEHRFDSKEMKSARRKLAEQLKNYSTSKHARISETVLNFFESVGTASKQGFLNRKLADSSFGFHASRWWEAAKAYVDHERKRHKEDGSLFEDFQDFAKCMRREGEVIDHDEVQRFLDDELKLE